MAQRTVRRRGVSTEKEPAAAPELDEAPVVSMGEAVGYDAIPCDREMPVSNSVGLKHDRLFLIADRFGNIMPPGNCSLGLFEDDTRILSHYELRMAGSAPARLSAQVVKPYAARIDLAVTDHDFGGNNWDPKQSVYLRRELLLDDSLTERLTIVNFLTRSLDYWVELEVGCDFADIFEVRGWRREGRGEFFAPVVSADGIRFAYRGRDGAIIESGVRFGTAPDSIDGRVARWAFRLDPGAPKVLQWEVGCVRGAQQGTEVTADAFVEREHRLAAGYETWRSACSGWISDVEVFDASLLRAVDDLRSLYVSSEGESVISAGVPWYSTVFGRDSIITSMETLAVNPAIAIDTLRYLARHQGTRVNAYTEEEPGKILHELRRGEMARSGEIPHVPYYGTIDATPLWLILLDETWRWTGDSNLVRELLPNARRALEWIDKYGDRDGDGFVEYASTNERGLANQGWKDSGDGVPYPDGRLPKGPIALIEVQAYVYDAKLRAATLFDAMGEPDTAERLRRESRELRQRVMEKFWLDDARTLALALDGDKHPIPTVTSNPGHALWCRIVDDERAPSIVDSLLGPDMFCGWGIRTLSSRHPVFNPMSYHNGSVWPHDNALAVMGMSHYGLGARALPVIAAMHDAAAGAEFNRLPELFCGMARDGESQPVLYPVSCSPQSWASGTLFLMLQAVLGILPDAPGGSLHIRNPVLPDFLQELTINNLSVGSARVALHFARRANGTHRNLLSIETTGAPLQVRIELG